MRALTAWTLAFVGFPLGGLTATLLIGRMETPLDALLGGVIAGAFVGGAQWLALRGRSPVSWRWVALTATGLGIGVSVSAALWGTGTDLESILLRAPLTGLALGFAQWLALRGWLRYDALWIVVVTILFPVAWFITSLVIGESINEAFFVFGASGALFFQLMTGLVLWRLLAPRH